MVGEPRIAPGLLLAALLLATGVAAGEIALVVHGGAGSIRPGDLSSERESAIRSKLTEALGEGYQILADGGKALDAVEATIRVLEDSPMFNAGVGAVFTADGRNELDASLMDGSTLGAGAVAGVTRIRNPISGARAVMEKSEHVLLAGPGADAFAESVGLEMADPSYFATERRREQLRKARQANAGGQSASCRADDQERHLGTAGAVALDRDGRIAAGTSTGGMTNKRHGRIGDSPLIGAGTYAGAGCGVSATGHGEYFIRFAAAHDVCARVAYLGLSIEESANQVLAAIEADGGEGGVIALDAEGNVAMPFTTEGMYRGHVGEDGTIHVEIYR